MTFELSSPFMGFRSVPKLRTFSEVESWGGDVIMCIIYTISVLILTNDIWAYNIFIRTDEVSP